MLQLAAAPPPAAGWRQVLRAWLPMMMPLLLLLMMQQLLKMMSLAPVCRPHPCCASECMKRKKITQRPPGHAHAHKPRYHDMCWHGDGVLVDGDG